MVKKIFPLWLEDSEIRDIKRRAETQNTSANKFILNKIIETPNLASGNWFDNPDIIRKIAKELRKEIK